MQSSARKLLIIVTLITALPAAAQTLPSLEEVIRERVEWLMFQEVAEIAGVRILSSALMGELYQGVAHVPLWQNRQQIDLLWQLADIAYAEGLDTGDYPLDALRTLLPAQGLPDEYIPRAQIDLVATEIFLRIGYQLRFGKVNPARLFPAWNFERSLSEGEARTTTLVNLIRSPALLDDVNAITHRGPLFESLIELLARYRAIENTGGWPAVNEGRTLRTGDDGPRVSELRARLAATGKLENTGSDIFDDALEGAVRHFQEQHGLDADGIVGKKTIDAMNVPVTYRILQIRGSLERARWVFDDFLRQTGKVVAVNIAAARTVLFEDGEIAWATRSQVGKPYRQTPVFRGEMQYLVFNPTWTVPPTILRNDVLPKLRRDREAYLESKHMDLLDRDGHKIDLGTVDWENLRSGNFPYIVRQRPGPWNALGMIKFIFPNPHFIFLHDTPSRELFQRAERAFSSGCIRVENPFELAEQLLNDPGEWNQESFQSVLDTQEQRVVHLSSSVPVYLLYWTAMPGEEDEAMFFRDIYGRDKVLLEAMDADPQIDLES